MILRKHNIKIYSAQDHAKEKAYPVIGYNDEIKKEFNSIVEASYYIIDKYPNIKYKNAYISIRNAILTETKAFDFNWICLKYSEKNKEEYLKKQKQYRKKSNSEIYFNTKIHCPYCGNLMDKESHFCKQCQNKQFNQQAIKEKQEKGITREFLKQEIRNKPFTTIAKEQGVSDNAIRKWCKLYNLPSKSSEIKKYSDEEWKNI